MSLILKKQQCPSCAKKGRDTSKDNLVVYDNGGQHCFSCGYTKPSNDILEKNLTLKYEVQTMGGIFTSSDYDALRQNATTQTKGYRGLKPETCAKYGVRNTLNEQTGLVENQYYPITKNSEICGVKWRTPDKRFISKGDCSTSVDLFGQAVFSKSTSPTIVIASGELDALSIYQMLSESTVASNSRNGTNYEPIPVVSSIIGESGSYKQLQQQYEFLNKFSKIIVCPDKDEAGEQALHALAKVLPKDKVFVIDLPKKDANEMLFDKKNNKPQDPSLQKEFVNRFFKARAYSPSGIVGSDALYDLLLSSSNQKKLTFPKFLSFYQEMLADGLEINSILNLIANTSIGKTTIVNELIYHWIFESPYVPGILTLELSTSKYAEALASRHLGKKLALIKDPEEKKTFLMQSQIKDKLNELYLKPDGSPRFWLMEEREGSLDKVKDLIEKLIIHCGCQIIVIDPLQDIFAGASIDEQEKFSAWMKMMILRYEIIFVAINHTRKPPPGTSPDIMPNEFDVIGSSSIIKSGHSNLIFNRNKYLDNIEKNITTLMCSKNRQTGETGLAGYLYYDNDSHTLYDLRDYYSMHPHLFSELPEKYDSYLGISRQE